MNRLFSSALAALSRAGFHHGGLVPTDTRPHSVTETGAACPVHPWMTDEERARSQAPSGTITSREQLDGYLL